jgi:hypothetical protein
MSMVAAPILEALDRGEISEFEAIRRLCHLEIKTLQEKIKRQENEIENR